MNLNCTKSKELLLLYDIEVFPNYLLIGVLDLANNYKKYESFLTDEGWQPINFEYAELMVSYGDYDHNVLMLIQQGLDPYEASKKVMGGLRSKKPPWFPLDCREIIREGYNIKSQKLVAANLKSKRLKTCDLPFDEILKKENVQEVIEYNQNDLQDLFLIFNKIKNKLTIRKKISNIFGIDAFVADSGIAKKIFDIYILKELRKRNIDKKLYEISSLRTKRTEIKLIDIIYPSISFKTKELNEWFEVLKTKTIKKVKKQKRVIEDEDDDEVEESFKCDIPLLEFGNKTYTLALGGIHSIDDPCIIEVDDTFTLEDADVTSQYPYAIIVEQVCPEHLLCFGKDIISSVLSQILTIRVDAKNKLKKFKEGSEEYIYNNSLQDGLKIALNTVYGLFNSPTYFLEDAKCTYEVTINNQLKILMLVEEFVLNGIEVVSANTDGVLCKVLKEQKEKYDSICKEWCEKTKFLLEFAQYKKYIAKDINNYLAIKHNGTIKPNGRFIPQNGILKGYNYPIIGLALQAYFIDGIKPEDFLRNHKDIFDFCKVQKIKDDYELYSQVINRTVITHGKKKAYVHPKIIDEVVSEKIEQRATRFFVSKQGVKLVKKRGDEQVMLCSGLVTIINDYFESEDYNIDYSFYENEIYKIINKICKK